MAAETVVIDVVTNFKDNMSGFDNEKAKADKFQKSLEKLQQQMKKLSSDKATPKVGVEDKATSKLEKVKSVLKTIKDKVISFPLKVIDKATAPLKKIKNALFNIKTLFAAVATGFAAQKLILNPINLADSYSSAKIGFQTLLGSSGGQDLMDQLDQFAKATPFKTSNTISQAQRMIAMGWDAKNIVADMTTIGDAAAATGKGDEGLQRIVTALAQIRSKGKLSTEELNQFAEAGISAKRYLAEGLGYGSGDEGIMKLSADLQKGAIGSEKAIQAIMSGMKEYQGMMDKTANETVEGLKSQIEDTFEINIFRKWGQGLQEGAKKGLGSIVELLDKSEDGLDKFGDQLQSIGSELSNLAADKLEKVIDKVLEVSDSAEFKNADAFGKIKIMWDEVIAKPFGDWWDTSGKSYFINKFENLGEGIGSGLSDIIKGILGFSDKAGDIVDDATSIGSGFAKGFVEGFDGSGIAAAIKECLSSAFSDALNVFKGSGDGSSYLSAAILGYLGLKGGSALLGGTNTILSLFGKQSIGSMLVGSAASGTGLAGLGANAAISLGAGNLAGGASLGAGALSALGLGSIAMGALGVGTVVSGVMDLKRGSEMKDKAGQEAYGQSAGKKVFGVGAGALAGAAIGSVVPVIGTAAGALIGAGIGGIAGWYYGNKEIEKYNKSVEEADEKTRKLKLSQEASKYGSDIMKKAFKETDKSLEDFLKSEEYAEAKTKAISENLKEHFGSISLSADEISTLANKIVGGDTKGLTQFADATASAKTSLTNLQSTYANMERMNWKAGLGFKLTSDEKESYKSSIDKYISSAKQYVEDKQYEFTSAVSLLMEVKDGSKGSKILAGGNAIYEKMQKDLDSYGGKLEKEVDIALKDGKIDVDEQKIISDYQAKIKEITDKLSNAESEAKMEALKIKFGGADMDYDSFSKLQEQIKSMVEERTSSYDEALEVSIANLKLQFPNGGADYDKALQEVTDSYNAKIDKMNVEVQGFQFDTLVDTYGSELEQALSDSNFSGTTQEKISQAMQQAMSEGVDVAKWDSETCKKYLGLDGLEQEAIDAITLVTSSIAQTLPESMNSAFSGLGESDGVSNAIKTSLETGVQNGAQNADLTIPSSWILERYGLDVPELPASESLTSATRSSVEKSAKEGVNSANLTVSGNEIAGRFGVSITQIPTIESLKTSTKLAIESSVKNGMSSATISGDGGLASKANESIASKMTPGAFSGAGSKAKSSATSAITSAFSGASVNVGMTVRVTPHLSLTRTSFKINASGGGTGSSTVNLSHNAAGGYIPGKTLSWLAEEGYGEFVIPTDPKRRGRAMGLLEQAAEALGVKKHASGGVVGSMIPRSKGKETDSKSSNNVSVNVGGITIQLSGGSEKGSVVSQLSGNKKQITSMISEMLNEAIEEAFESLPLSAG